MTKSPLHESLLTGAIAFRGYNTTNLGRTPELLEHPLYGPTVERHLHTASQIAADTLKRPVDLVERMRQRRESTLETFGEDIALILSVSLAQLELLATHFEIRYADARVAVGYSLGEITALVASGLFELADVLVPLLALADECVELAHDTTMGILFSRGPVLDQTLIQKLCTEISCEGQGVIDISSVLSPNTVLVMGQGATLDRLRQRVAEVMPKSVYLRKNDHRWPPLHTPLLWQRNIPNRAAQLMYRMPRGFKEPTPPILSLVTGKTSYNDFNSRQTINQWLDHPQRLWDAVYELLSTGTELIVHVGPEPNLIPATFKRLSDNVMAAIEGPGLNRLGMRAVQRMANRPWLARVMSSRVALLRAPFVRHLVVEDWLLDQPDVKLPEEANLSGS